MLWVVRITAVFPRLVDIRDITSHMKRFAIGSIPNNDNWKIFESFHLVEKQWIYRRNHAFKWTAHLPECRGRENMFALPRRSIIKR